MQSLKLLLSVFISSWQFFKEAVHSPCIEFSLNKTAEEKPSQWQEFSLRPEKLSILDIIKSLFFNPRWNEALFIMDCAERIVIEASEDMSQEILMRIETELQRRDLNLKTNPYLQFRLVSPDKERDLLFQSKTKKILGCVES